MPDERLDELGISKVMTITSTYDHRIIQGAESGAFLGIVDRLLQGEEGFYDLIAESLELSRGELSGRPRRRRRPQGRPESRSHRRCCITWPRPWRWSRRSGCTATSPPSSIRWAPSRSATRRWIPAPLGLTPEIMAAIPSKVLRIAVPGRTLAESLPYLQATYCGTMAYEIEHISTHEERVWLREKIESGAYRKPLPPDQQRRLLQPADRGRDARALPAQGLPGAEAVLHRGRGHAGPDARSHHRERRRVRRPGRGDRHGAPGRLNVLAHTIGRPYETIFAEFEGGRQVEGGQLTPEGGTGDVKYHHGAEGAYKTRQGQGDHRQPVAQPEPPRVRRPGGGRPGPGQADPAPGPGGAPRSDRRPAGG